MSEAKATVASDRKAASGFPEGGGCMGELIREKDWSSTPLGGVETWSTSLRMMVSFMLANRFPLLLWWGPEYLSIYNDPYRPVLGNKHPTALGQPVRECWSEIWHILKPLIDSPFTGGPATWMDDLALEINRHGFVEETHFTVAYSPVPDETAHRGIGGVLATVHEITEKVIGERRVEVLRDLGLRVAEGRTAEAACAIAAETLGNHPKDVPFALLYLLDEDGAQARLAGVAGDVEEPVCPPAVNLMDVSDDMAGWPLAEAVRTEAAVVIDDLEQRFESVPAGPWSDPPRCAVIVPIRSNRPRKLAGLLVAGVSARLSLDDLYVSFFDLVGSQIATAIANARSYEEERRRAEALAEIDRAKTAFFSNVSHEFRTPLTLMLGPIEELLQEPELALLPGTYRRRLDVAHRNSLRLLRLVNTLLDFSRIEAGRVQASYRPTDLATLTIDLASGFRSAIEGAGLLLTVECEPLPEPVYVDRDMWEKVVLNLLSNAFKFTFEGGIAITLTTNNGCAELRVRDTGVGIPEQELPNIFERFYRSENSRGRTHEGTGIGLALVRELVQLHAGTVHVESEPGAGTCFRVCVPLGTAHLPPDQVREDGTSVPAALAAQPYLAEALQWLPEADIGSTQGSPKREWQQWLPASAHDRKRETVLVADDNADMRDYVSRLLAPYYAVRTVADGAEAFAAMQESRPDLVLSDVMMPNLDGFALVRTVRANPALVDLPIILLSARAGEEESVRGLEVGADDYLVKPFGARELLARVGSTLQMSRLRREYEQRITLDLRDMTRLHEVSIRCVQAGYGRDACLQDILDAAIEIMQADKGNIQLLDTRSNTLKIAVQRGFDEPFLRFFAEVRSGDAAACGSAMDSENRITAEDITRSDIFAGQPSLDVLLEAGVRAMQSTPLLGGRGAVLGMISTHFTQAHQPGDRELRLLDLLARQAADYLERNQVEDALRKVRLQLQTIFDETPLGVYLVDSEFRIRSVNPTALPFFGDIPDVIGREFDEVIHRLWPEQHADAMIARFRHTLETGETYYVPEWIEERLDRGVTEYYAWRISRIPLTDGKHGVVCFFQDISAQVHSRHALAETGKELRRMNEQLEARVAAEVVAREEAQARLAHAQRMEALGQLAGGIAHDFNNVLQAVSGGLGLIQRRTENPDVRRYAGMAADAAARGSAITGRLLAFARQSELRAAPVNPLHLLKNLSEMLAPVLGTAIEIEVEVPADVPPLLVDKAQLETVLVNLAVNARDAMPEGGRFAITATAELVSGKRHPADLKPGRYLRIELTDTGSGMNEATLVHAAEPFFTTKPTGQGTGLGLAMARGFAQQSGGGFAISSALGKGTTVTMWFPEAETDTSEIARTGTPHAHLASPARVLVADDDAMVRDILAYQLVAQGFSVSQASDGLAALAQLEAGDIPDLLVTDFAMPGMNGLMLIKEARRRRPGLPALLLTGYADGNLEGDVSGLMPDPTAVLRKPVSDAELAECAAVLLNARALSREDFGLPG